MVFSPGTAGAADQRAHRTPINVDRQPLETVEPSLPQNVFPWPGRLAPPCSALVARRMVALLDSRPIGRGDPQPNLQPWMSGPDRNLGESCRRNRIPASIFEKDVGGQYAMVAMFSENIESHWIPSQAVCGAHSPRSSSSWTCGTSVATSPETLQIMRRWSRRGSVRIVYAMRRSRVERAHTLGQSSGK
jgi:hypothetical protein